MNILQTIAQESKVEVISTVKMATSDKELKDFLENNQDKKSKNVEVFNNVDMESVKFEFSREQGVSLNDFELKALIGQGTFSKVYLVQNINTDKTYAMKVIKKKTIIDSEKIEMIKQEQRVLEILDSPWLLKLEHSF